MYFKAMCTSHLVLKDESVDTTDRSANPVGTMSVKDWQPWSLALHSLSVLKIALFGNKLTRTSFTCQTFPCVVSFGHLGQVWLSNLSGTLGTCIDICLYEYSCDADSWADPVLTLYCRFHLLGAPPPGMNKKHAFLKHMEHILVYNKRTGQSLRKRKLILKLNWEMTLLNWYIISKVQYV